MDAEKSKEKNNKTNLIDISLFTLVKDKVYKLIFPVTRLLVLLNISSNYITIAGLFLIITGSLFLVFERFYLAMIFWMVGGLCDLIDGQLAHYTGNDTLFGALFDSIADRFSDLAIFIGACFLFIIHGDRIGTIYIWLPLALIAIITAGVSFGGSYISAMAYGFGYHCNIGLWQRPERLVVMITGCLFGIYGIAGAISIVFFLATYTFFQRLIFCYKNMR